MKMIQKWVNRSGIAFFFFLTVSCKQSDFLDANPNQANVLPKTTEHFQALLNNSPDFNYVPGLLEDAAEDYYWIKDRIQVWQPEYKNIYTWNDDIWAYSFRENWSNAYNSVFQANVVLEGLEKNKNDESDKDSWNNAKGQALFFRAFHFYNLAQLFAPQYESGNAASQLGIPLRLKADLGEKIKRSNLQETYDRIINDLKIAENLLPVIPATNRIRPSKHAVMAMLARVYLQIGDYDNALKYANDCLSISSQLLDFNEPDVIQLFNVEVIWYAFNKGNFLPFEDYTMEKAVDSNFVKSYVANDTRSGLFFQDNLAGTGKFFKGSYNGRGDDVSNVFAGLATDEVYLIRAECYARLGNKDLALGDLNSLMVKRWKNNGTWIPVTAISAEQALISILIERRKELVFRGLRWPDLRRLNKLGANITLMRKLDDGTVVTLPPNSLKYTFLIPGDVMSFHPDMPQNAR